MKLISQLDANNFHVKIEEVSCDIPHVSIAHDYIRFYSKNYFTDLDGATSSISYNTDITLQVRSAQQVLLPMLNEHEYMQPDHLCFVGRPNYNYVTEFFGYYKNGKSMVAVRVQGETEFNHVTTEFFNKLIKPNL